jgi:hypothetical protein
VANINAIAANVCWGVGAALAGGGVALWVLDAPAPGGPGVGGPKAGGVKMMVSGSF